MMLPYYISEYSWCWYRWKT